MITTVPLLTPQELPIHVRLGDVCEQYILSRDPKRSPEENFTYIDISSIDSQFKKIVSPKILAGREAPSRARQIVRTGDVIVATTRPNLNAVALIGSQYDGYICSTGFCVLRPKPDRLDSVYLFAYTRSPMFKDSLSDLVKGALYPAVSDKQVFDQSIPLPPLDA